MSAVSRGHGLRALRTRARGTGLVWIVATLAGFASPACRAKASRTECDALIDRYASLVVQEGFPDAGADRIKTEQERERSEARRDDAFKNCSSEVSRAELDCAMRAPTASAFEKCLE